MGFKKLTQLDLMGVVIISGFLLAFAVPNFTAMQNRAKEGQTKALMHTVQLAAEDYGVQFKKRYPSEIGGPSDQVNAGFVNLLPGARLQVNAFTGQVTEPRLGPSPDSASAGSVWYTPRFDSVGVARGYLIEGFGRAGKLPLALASAN